MASSSLSILSLHVRFSPSHALFIWTTDRERNVDVTQRMPFAVLRERLTSFLNKCTSNDRCTNCESHLVDGFLNLWFFRFPAGKDEVSPEGPDELQLLSQAVRLALDGLQKRSKNTYLLHLHVLYTLPLNYTFIFHRKLL